eukprot:4364832-Amphidinium_carterae.1
MSAGAPASSGTNVCQTPVTAAATPPPHSAPVYSVPAVGNKRRRATPAAKRTGLPPEMVGCVAQRADKQPICFSFHTGHCSFGKLAGQRCNT